MTLTLLAIAALAAGYLLLRIATTPTSDVALADPNDRAQLESRCCHVCHGTGMRNGAAQHASLPPLPGVGERAR